MRHIPRLYIPESLFEPGASLTLEGVIRHRLVNVQRVREKQKIILFNGIDAKEAQAEISRVARREITLDVLKVEKTDRESPLQTNLYQSLEKPDRMDYAIQKAVELGVSNIQPILTAYSLPAFKPDRLAKKMSHWQGIIIHACEQSGRCLLPSLREPLAFPELLQQRKRSVTGLIPDPDAMMTLQEIELDSADSVDILIGPIGGYTRDEINLALKKDLQSIKLGPRILRTETAGPAMLAILQSRFGDLR